MAQTHRPQREERSASTEEVVALEPTFATQFKESFHSFWLIAVGIVKDASLAEDVVQEAALIALKKWHQFRPGTNFGAWIAQIVRHVAHNKARAERKRRWVGSVDPSALHGAVALFAPPTAETGTAGQRDRGEHDRLSERLCEALDHVGDVARACLLLRTVEGLNYARIAALLGIPEGTAMSHVHRARRRLRDELGRFDSETANPMDDRR